MFRFLYFRAKKKIPPPISADNQELNDLKSKAVVEDGIMKFRDNEHFNEFFKLSFDELTTLEKTFGYTSYDSRIDQVIDELDLVATKSEFKSFKKKYQNYMTTRIRDNEESYESIIFTNTRTLIANENGLYFIGDTAYRVIGEYLISSEIKKVDQLLNIGYDDLVKGSFSQQFKILKYITIHDQKLISLKATTVYLTGDITEHATNPDGDRRVYLRAYAFTNAVDGGQQYLVNLYAWGQKKSWLSGWRDYKTAIYMYGNDPGVDVVVSTPYWGLQTFEVGAHQTSSDSKTLPVQLFNQIKMMSGDGDPIYFTKVNLKANTRGTGSTYVYINAIE